jgi:mannose PTS system EIIA component
LIGIAIFTHRQLGEELLKSAESIMGEQSKVVVVSVLSKDSLLSIKDKCRHALESQDDGGGILVLADVLGGSASNASLGLIGEFPLEIVTGVNLPMLISAFANRNRMVLKELAQKVLDDGIKSIVNVKDLYLKSLKVK